MVALVRAGHDNLAIATALGLRRSTVKQYLHLIYTAVGVRSRGELRLALQEMLAAPDGGGVSDG
jgi:DNA-binding NarL/FixJ family response regulator